jgi:N-acetylneuraminate synthase
MDPKALKELIRNSNELVKMRGGKKEMVKEEQVTVDFAFATVVTIKSVKKGESFTEENIWVKRPGTGDIKAEDYQSLLKKRALVDIEDDIHLKWEYVEK